MKKISELLTPSFAFLLLATLTFTACSTDDDKEPIIEPDPEPGGIVVEGCDTFTESVPSLNSATIDFECNGTSFF